MGFLRKGKNKANAEASADKKPSIKKGLSRRLFGSASNTSKKLVDQDTLATDHDKEQATEEVQPLVFSHQFVTVDAEKGDDPNNTTVESMESIEVLTTPEEAYRQQQETSTEGTELVLPGSKDPSISEGSVYTSNDNTHPDDESSEKVGLDIVSVEEQAVTRSMPEEPANVSAASSKNTAKENSLIQVDDDDITEHPPTTVSSQQQPDGPRQRVERAAKAFIQGMTCTAQDMENCAALPTNLGGIAMPITACQPIINQQAAAAHGKANIKDPTGDHYDEMFAVKFLNDLLNVGFTLVHHSAVDDEEDWIGRTVNLNFKPGVCTSRRIVGPSVQWTTMGGGKDVNIGQESVGLFEIDAIAVSNIQNELDPISTQQYEEELDCFFSITSKQGDVYLFEAISAEESQRIVLGMKNISFRLSSQVIAGDSKAVADFFDNSKEPEETHLRKNAAMMKISNAYLDDVL